MSSARPRRTPEETRRAILKSSIEVFADRGFFGARVSTIAQAAGVAEGTLYVHFKSKDQLLVEAFREYMAVILDRLATLVSRDEPPTAKLRRYIQEHLELVAAEPKLMHFLSVELRQNPEFLRRRALHGRFGRYLAMLAGIVAEGQSHRFFRQDRSAVTIGRAIFGALDQVTLSWVLVDGAIPDRDARVEVAQGLADFFLDGLLEKD